MKALAKLCLGAAFAVALTGCAGRNFVRPDDASLQNGKTTIAEARATYGKPYRTGDITKNDQTVTVLSYAFATKGGTPLEAGVTPARAMDLAFWKGVMVSHCFASSFKDDATNFDAEKRQQIVKGKTTRAEVIDLLGKPAGYAIYPMIKDEKGEGLMYSYNTTRGSAFNLKFAHKVLIVTVDPEGIVSDINYESSGM